MRTGPDQVAPQKAPPTQVLPTAALRSATGGGAASRLTLFRRAVGNAHLAAHHGGNLPGPIAGIHAVSQPGDPFERAAEQVAQVTLPDVTTHVAGEPPRPSEYASAPVHQSLGPGVPLSTETRARFEGPLGHDLGRVRVHADERAAASAQALDASAFTIGKHVVFGADQYRPRTYAGDRLLAHELAHVALGHSTGVADVALRQPAPDAQVPQADPEAVLGQRLVRDFPSGVAVAFYAPMPSEKEEARNAAEKWAIRESALGIRGKAVTAANIVFGGAIPDAEHPLAATLQALGRVLTAAVSKASPVPGGPTPPGMGAPTVRTLAIFAHGTSDWCGLGAITSSTAASVIKKIAPTLAPDVTVVLYSCNAGRDPDASEEWVKGTMRGGGAKSLAARTRDALIAEGKGGSVWGHTTTGHVTENFALREFSTTSGKGSAGTSFVASYVFTGPDKVETASELLDGVIAQGYEVTSPRAQANAEAVIEDQMYRCYAVANRELLFKGGKLAESAPIHPVEVGKAIKDYWTTTYWPANKSKAVDKLRAQLVAARRAKKATPGTRP
ncbi:MAG: DUF4157 domain-containing protein [Pseudonocardiaceae bacterium]